MYRKTGRTCVLFFLSNCSLSRRSWCRRRYLLPGRRWTADRRDGCGTREIRLDIRKSIGFMKLFCSKKSENHTVSIVFCPHSTSVSKIGSEEPILLPASPREKLGGCAALSSQQIDKLKFEGHGDSRALCVIKMRGKTSELHSGDDSAYIILLRLFVFWLRIVCFCGIINP